MPLTTPRLGALALPRSQANVEQFAFDRAHHRMRRLLDVSHLKSECARRYVTARRRPHPHPHP